MSDQTGRRRGSANPPARKFKMVSVKLDVLTDSRVCVAASLAGLDKSAFLSGIISKAVSGIVIIDRRKSNDHVDLSAEVDRESAA